MTPAEAYSTPRSQSFLAAIAITLLVLGLGFIVFGFTPAIIASLYIGAVASYAAIPYTVFAIVARALTARRGRARDQVEATVGVESAYRSDVLEFSTFRQRASLVNAIVMLAALVVTLVLTRPWEHIGTGTNLGGMSVLGAFAIVAGVFAIVVNAPAIYRDEFVRAERHAMAARVGAWRLIRASTILTTTSWIAYCGFGLTFITSGMWS